jgi:hypothetical protein
MIDHTQPTPVVIVNFPRFAGGKFLINCLALSQHVCIPHAKFVDHLLNYPRDKQYRLQAVLSSLPSDRASMKNWINQWEFGEVQLFGLKFIEALKNQTLNRDQIPKSIARLFESKMTIPLTCHVNTDIIKQIISYWPNSQVVNLINYKKFSAISRQLKSDTQLHIDVAGNYCEEKYNFLSGSSWPQWQQFESVGFNAYKLNDIDPLIQQEIDAYYRWQQIDCACYQFDIDGTIFQKDLFIEAVKQLYCELGFDDFDPDLVAVYWQHYIDLHCNPR